MDKEFWDDVKKNANDLSTAAIAGVPGLPGDLAHLVGTATGLFNVPSNWRSEGMQRYLGGDPDNVASIVGGFLSPGPGELTHLPMAVGSMLWNKSLKIRNPEIYSKLFRKEQQAMDMVGEGRPFKEVIEKTGLFPDGRGGLYAGVGTDLGVPNEDLMNALVMDPNLSVPMKDLLPDQRLYAVYPELKETLVRTIQNAEDFGNQGGYIGPKMFVANELGDTGLWAVFDHNGTAVGIHKNKKEADTNLKMLRESIKDKDNRAVIEVSKKDMMDYLNPGAAVGVGPFYNTIGHENRHAITQIEGMLAREPFPMGGNPGQMKEAARRRRLPDTDADKWITDFISRKRKGGKMSDQEIHDEVEAMYNDINGEDAWLRDGLGVRFWYDTLKVDDQTKARKFLGTQRLKTLTGEDRQYPIGLEAVGYHHLLDEFFAENAGKVAEDLAKQRLANPGTDPTVGPRAYANRLLLDLASRDMEPEQLLFNPFLGY